MLDTGGVATLNRRLMAFHASGMTEEGFGPGSWSGNARCFRRHTRFRDEISSLLLRKGRSSGASQLRASLEQSPCGPKKRVRTQKIPKTSL